MSFLSTGELLEKVTHKSPSSSVLKAIHALVVWEKAVSEVLGEKASGKTQAILLKDGVLTVLVPSSVWMQELQLQASKLLGVLNRKLGKRLVDRLRFRIKR